MDGSGTPKTEAVKRSTPPRVTVRAVLDFLHDHPDFLLKHPDLARVLAPPSPHGDGGPLDLQQYMLQRLRRDVARLEQVQETLIAASRDNVTAQSRVHDAVLALLEATTFEHLIHIATQDCAVILELDAISICIETADGRLPEIVTTGVHALPAGQVAQLLGEGREVLLREKLPEDATIYGPASALIRSDALVRLRVSGAAPLGLLCLGTREAGKFHPGQGTELLTFFAGSIARLIRLWLDLPPT